MKIETDAYSVNVSDDFSKVTFKGTLRLQGREQYQKIFDILLSTSAQSSDKLELDMQELIFLNSSGISTLSLFIIEMRKIEKPMAITGSKTITWQTKSLYNFQRLYKKVEIIIV